MGRGHLSGTCCTEMIRYAALFGSICFAVLPITGHAQAMVDTPNIDGLSRNGDHREDRSRAIGCLATAIAYEAGYESVEGQRAVAEVILNRLRHTGYPKTVCGVVFAGSERRTGCQFSFTCDGSLNRRMSSQVMTGARMIATSALDGLNPVSVAGATHYHADYVSPYWAPSLIRIAKIGAHIFYRGAGARDQDLVPQPYAPFGEPQIAQLSMNGSVTTSVAPTPSRSTTPARPTVFAPWGLAPPASSSPTD